MAEPILTVEHLVKGYGENTVLDDVSLAVRPGEVIVVVGPSGCGKSTLLRLLKRELAPEGEKSGEIIFCGKEQSTLSEREAACEIGYVLQNPENQIVTDKVWHELAFGLESLGYDTPSIRLRVAEMASYFGIHQWFYKNVSELSGGQKQLLNLAAIMAMHPKLLILDEPTRGIDIGAKKDIYDLMNELTAKGVSIIMVSSELPEVIGMSDRILVIHEGRAAGIVEHKDATQTRIMTLATGGE